MDKGVGTISNELKLESNEDEVAVGSETEARKEMQCQRERKS